ncbi:MAG: FkbM family methyltransferase [Candidatus Sericytochromatia bacterium]|nr:FkbM family methyltransferase [Candidatus Sericytochromatia bacterium]
MTAQTEVPGFNLRRPCRYGEMVFHRQDRFIGRSLDRYGEWAEYEIAWLRQMLRAGDTVVDAGANVGTHTLPLARHVGPSGHVVAFEPQRLIFQALCANLALNSLANVDAWQAALGATSGAMIVPAMDPARTMNFGGVSLGGFAEGESVPLTTIDALDLAACHLIKIDVEGMESAVLQGAAATISRHQPILYVENDRQAQVAPLIQQIQAQGYRLWWHVSTFFHPDNCNGVAKNVFPDLFGMNMLALPPDSDVVPEAHPAYRVAVGAPTASDLTNAHAFGLPVLGGEIILPIPSLRQ